MTTIENNSNTKPNIIVFQGSFHGRTAQTMAMTTSKTVYRAGYTPLPSGVTTGAPYPPCASVSRRTSAVSASGSASMPTPPMSPVKSFGKRFTATARRVPSGTVSALTQRLVQWMVLAGLVLGVGATAAPANRM